MATATQGHGARSLTGLHGDRLSLLTSGVAPLVSALAGLVVLEGPADRPELDQPPVMILSFFAQQDTVILGSFLLMLAAALFLWFAGCLRAALRNAEGGEGRLSAIAFGAGVAAAALMLVMPAVNVCGALSADFLSVRQAQTLYLLGDAFLYPAAMAAAVMLGATATVALRTGVLVRWLAWPSLALALWLLVPPLGQSIDAAENPAPWTGLAALPLVLVWAAVTAVVLALDHRDR